MHVKDVLPFRTYRNNLAPGLLLLDWSPEKTRLLVIVSDIKDSG